MRREPAPSTAAPWRNATLPAAIVAALTHALLHLSGTAITEDGWAYWQGAVNLAEQGSYTYFSGDPILAWPPLYSLYLAAWTIVLGPSATTLIAANGVLVIAQAWGWTRLAEELSRDSGLDPAPGAALAVAVFIGLFVALNGRFVLAHNLLYAILPLQILATWRLCGEITEAPLRAQGLFWLFASAALLAHSAAAVFLLASMAAFFLLTSGSLLARAVSVTFFIIPPVAAWGGVRWWLGQTGSHAVGAGRESWLTYVEQAATGIGELIAPHQLAPVATVVLVALAAMLIGWSARTLARFLAVFVGVAVATLIALFSVTWVNDPLAGRFVAFVPLLVVPLLLHAASRRHALLVPALAAAVIPLQAWRVAKWSFDNPHIENPRVFVPLEGELSRIPVQGSTRQENGRVLIAPSPWQERRGRTD